VNFVALALFVWITAILIASVVHGLRSGVISLIGPYVRVRWATNPVGFTLAVALLLVPTVISALGTGAFLVMTFPYQRIPSPPANGYAGSVAASGAVGYFPAALTRATYKCADFPRAVPLLSSEDVGWYSKHLAAAGEPSFAGRGAHGAKAGDAYRFTWLRSFDKPVVIRIQEGSAGVLLMTASRLSGKGGYEPGAVEARVERPLTTAEAGRFRRALAAAGRLRLKAVTCRHGYDGASWIFEAVDGGAYRYVERWSPKAGPVRALGLEMLSFAGWAVDPAY